MDSKMGLTTGLGLDEFPADLDFGSMNSPLLMPRMEGPEMPSGQEGRMISEGLADSDASDRPGKRGRT
jgi:hypothetical protein